MSTVKQILFYMTEAADEGISFLDEIIAQHEAAEDKRREDRGLMLLSYEVPVDFFWKLNEYCDKTNAGGREMLIRAFEEYMIRHPA